MASIGPNEFASLMTNAGVNHSHPIAIGVSGGADSVALALLAIDWWRSGSKQPPPLGLVVDHGLRPDSASEAIRAAQWVRNLGGNAHVIGGRENLWAANPDPLSSAIQSTARSFRFGLLNHECAKHDIKTLLLGHHMHDQAETVLMRFASGSGIEGLAGMDVRSKLPGCSSDVDVVRPLLGIPPDRLRATLTAASQPWIEDPSNSDSKFYRVRIRQALGLARDFPTSAMIDLPPEDIVRVANTLAATRVRVRRQTDSWISANSHAMDDWCAISLSKSMLAKARPHISTRVVSAAIEAINRVASQPKAFAPFAMLAVTVAKPTRPVSLIKVSNALSRVFQPRVTKSAPPPSASIGGCLLSTHSRSKAILVTPEKPPRWRLPPSSVLPQSGGTLRYGPFAVTVGSEGVRSSVVTGYRIRHAREPDWHDLLSSGRGSRSAPLPPVAVRQGVPIVDALGRNNQLLGRFIPHVPLRSDPWPGGTVTISPTAQLAWPPRPTKARKPTVIPAQAPHDAVVKKPSKTDSRIFPGRVQVWPLATQLEHEAKSIAHKKRRTWANRMAQELRKQSKHVDDPARIDFLIKWGLEMIEKARRGGV